jgi:hypothetical protein
VKKTWETAKRLVDWFNAERAPEERLAFASGRSPGQT